VLSHARALLKSTPQGACAYLDADLRDPEAILAAAARTPNFSTPVAVTLIAVLHFIGDDAQAGAIVSRLMAACVPGSFVVISHVGGDIDAEQQTEMVRRLNESVAEKATMRDRAGVTRLFDGLELLDPGVIRVAAWRPDPDLEAASPTGLWGGAGQVVAAVPGPVWFVVVRFVAFCLVCPA
jgi:hypothetical protein